MLSPEKLELIFDNLMTIYIILYILDNIYINLNIYMDEILFLISLVREWHCDESWMRNRDIARCNRTARQC